MEGLAKNPTPEGIIGKRGHSGEELMKPAKTEPKILSSLFIKESCASECSIMSLGERVAHDLTH